MNRKYLFPPGISFKLCKWNPESIDWMNILPVPGSIKDGWDKFIQEDKVILVMSYPNNIPKSVPYKVDSSELKDLKPLITAIRDEYKKLYSEAKDSPKRWMITGRRYEDLILKDIIIDPETYEILPVIY